MQLDSNFFLETLELGQSVLSQGESFHIAKSFRARAGDALTLCDGKGRFASAELLEPSPEACRVLISSISQQAPPPRISLAIGCLQNGEEEDIAFHAAQLPIAAISLLRTERSLEPRASGLGKLLRRMEAKSMAALKQSRKPWLTEIKAPVYLSEFLDNFKGSLIACDIGGQPASGLQLPAQSPAAVLSGPEGGFSPAELEAMKSKGAFFLALGAARLRAASAPLFALGRLLDNYG